MEYSRFHGYTYDGIWAVALAIQNVAHKIKYFRRNQTVNDFRYRDPLWERLFLDALHNTSFEGANFYSFSPFLLYHQNITDFTELLIIKVIFGNSNKGYFRSETGVTGPVRFYDNERKASILLKQFQEGREIKVGEYSAATQHLDLGLGAPLRWIGK